MITYFSSNRVLDLNFGATSYSVPSTYYFGLSTTTINIDGTGSSEPSSGSYARIGLANNTSNWANASSASKANLTAVTFVESTASWGTITYVLMADSITTGGGNIWWFDVLTPSRTVATATTVLFAIGAITVSMSNT